MKALTFHFKTTNEGGFKSRNYVTTLENNNIHITQVALIPGHIIPKRMHGFEIVRYGKNYIVVRCSIGFYETTFLRIAFGYGEARKKLKRG